MPKSLIRKLAAALPARFGEWLFRHGPRRVLAHLESRNRLAHADIARCIAFSDELNYFPSVWLNDQRFPQGMHYDEPQRAAVLQNIAACLRACTDPDTGQPVIRDIFAREDLYHGPALAWIPDLIVVPAMDGDYSMTIWSAPCSGPAVTRLPEHEMRGRKGGSMNGSHRPYGVLFSSEPLPGGDAPPPCLEDIGVSILARAGMDIRTMHLDGRPLFASQSSTVTDADALHPTAHDAMHDASAEVTPYTDDEAREIENRLKQLGYL